MTFAEDGSLCVDGRVIPVGKFDLHTHTTFSDGKNTPEEMVLSAIEKGLEAIGFSDHSYTEFDTSFCVQKKDIDAYLAEIGRLKKKYRSKIAVLCGIEQDLFGTFFPSAYDYRIGSVHYVKKGDVYADVDHTKEIFLESVNSCFGGDCYAYAEAYFAEVAQLARVAGADIIGHFDLVSKFNEGGVLFDEENPRYVRAWQNAVDEILKHIRVFEMNFGAVARGYRTTPYPSKPIQDYILSHGGVLIKSSDSHNVDNIGFWL